MKARLCAAILLLEAIVLGLTTPVLISVVGVSAGRACAIGLGLAGACVVVAGLLRFDWAYPLGWVIQIAAIALGVLISSMYALGAIFLALWATAYFLGRKIETERAAAEAEYAARQGPH